MTDSPATIDQPAAGVIVRNASFGYGRSVVLRDVDVELRPGSITYLIGPNGSGKSTLLHALGGLSMPMSGDVLVHGVPAQQHRGRTAFVVQSPATTALIPISVRELVGMGRYPGLGLVRRQRASDRAAVQEALERMDIAELAGVAIHELSGGQRQRALIAQALAQDADVLLLDEPLVALDPPTRERVMTTLRDERASGVTVVISTHELTEAATGDDVLLLAGEAVAFGPPGAVLVPAVLERAYGGRVLRLADGSLLLDDGAHHHEHHRLPDARDRR